MPDTIALQRDLRYREGKSGAWKLDLALPKERSVKPRPALVIIHGGGWIEGDKSSFTSLEYWRQGTLSILPGSVLSLPLSIIVCPAKHPSCRAGGLQMRCSLVARACRRLPR